MQALVTGAVVSVLYLFSPGLHAQTKEIRGLPPRATPADYQANAAAGTVTIAAEFLGHAVPTAQGTLSTETFVVVEAGIFGQPDAGIKLSLEDFSLRINGKNDLPSQPFGLVGKSLKDPDLEPPASASSKTKTNVNGGGGGGQVDSNAPPAPVHIPIEVQRSMQQRTQKAALPEGDRPLPVAGLLFFQYSGKAKSIRSVDLIYNGPAGKATLELQP